MEATESIYAKGQSKRIWNELYKVKIILLSVIIIIFSSLFSFQEYIKHVYERLYDLDLKRVM